MIEGPESFWDELLSFVEAKSVIPIIGPELAIVEYEGRVEPSSNSSPANSPCA